MADLSGLYSFYKQDNSIEGLARTANVEELVSSVQAFVEERQEEAEELGEGAVFTLDDFLENVSLLSNVDVNDEEDTNNKVSLMTVHSAKGLEYPYVFVAGMEENLFPSLSMLSSTQDIEEERRLFYVAMTRAKVNLFLSYAATRMRNGKHESNSPSRFIREVDSAYFENPLDDEDFDDEGITHEWGGFGSRFRGGRIDRIRQEPARPAPRPTPMPAGHPSAHQPVQSRAVPQSLAPARTPAPDPDFVPVPMTELYAGEEVEHNRFGYGKIKSITGQAPDLKAVIDFEAYGEKLLLLKYAKLRPKK